MTVVQPGPLDSAIDNLMAGLPLAQLGTNDITLDELFARTNANPKTAFGYIRVSSLNEKRKMDGEITVETQKINVETFAARERIAIVGWIYDLNISGRRSHFLQRKILPTIKRVADGEAECVIVYNVSRWGRSSVENQLSEAMLWDARGRLLSATEPNDERSTSGKMTRQLLYMMAEHQSNVIGDSWVAAHQARLRRGLPRSGAPRLGYDYVRIGIGQAEYKIDPFTGPLLAAAYREHLRADKPIRAIARELRERGIATPGTKELICYQSLRRAMDSGFGAGRLIVDAHSDKPSYLIGSQQPVISSGEWDEYLAKRKASKAVAGHTPQAAAWPLQNLVFCGSCLKPMVRALTRGVFVCNGKGRAVNANGKSCAQPVQVQMHIAEEAVRAWLRVRANPEAPEGFSAEFERRQAATTALGDAERLRSKLGSHQRVKKNYKRMRANEIIETDQELKEMLVEVDEQIDEIEKALAKIERSVAVHKLPGDQAFGAALVGWEFAALAPAGVNAALKTLIRGVYVGAGRNTMTPEKFDIVGTWEKREPKVVLGPITVDTTTGKFCGKCRQYKDVTAFYRHKTGKAAGTLTPRCKECLGEAVRTARLARKQAAGS